MRKPLSIVAAIVFIVGVVAATDGNPDPLAGAPSSTAIGIDIEHIVTTLPLASTTTTTTTPGATTTTTPGATTTVPDGTACPGAPNEPDGEDPWGGCFPGASNTGVPPGTVLTSYVGSLSLNVPGTIIDSKIVNGCFGVSAANIIIRNSLINCGSSFGTLAYSSATNLLIEDSTYDCGQTPTTAIAGAAGYTVHRVETVGCVNGFDVSGNVWIEDTWVHDDYHEGAAHADAIQMSGGGDIVIVHNTLITDLGSSAIISATNGHNGVLIENNLMAGGAFTLYCPRDTATDYSVIDNVFSRLVYDTVGDFGPIIYCGTPPGTVDEFSGNIRDDGTPVAP